jgi:fibronectin-binding autotransporter adhesin
MIIRVLNLLLPGLLALCLEAQAVTVSWVDWTSANASAATGTMTFGSTTVTVNYSGQLYASQTSGGTNYWNPATAYLQGEVTNAPPTTDILQMSTAAGRSLTFSRPVTDLYFAYVSLNGNGFVFSQDFTIVSQGTGYWGNGTATKSSPSAGQYALTGTSGEPHGLIKFTGTFSSLSWTSNSNETWYGFTVAAAVPEPGSASLLILGLAAVLARSRRCRR